jgi:hypothetical protein
MLLLTDVYCMYNRGRGTELISPDDVLEAAKLLVPLKLGMRLRTMAPHGVVVIQLDSFSDEEVGRRIQQKLEADAAALPGGNASKAPYTTALQLSTAWRVPVQLAQQHLLVRPTQLRACVLVANVARVRPSRRSIYQPILPLLAAPGFRFATCRWQKPGASYAATTR